MAMTVKSGQWSDPTVWDGGVVPGANAMAHIKAPHKIVYDLESDVILADVMSDMGSHLKWDTTKETRMRVNTIMLNGILEMVDHGLSTTPGKPKHEIVFHPIAGKEPGAGMGLGLVTTGPTRIHGYAKKGRLRSGDLSIAAGATSIALPGLATSGWQVGDTLIILGTNYVPTASTDPQYTGPATSWIMSDTAGGGNGNLVPMNTFQFGQDEQRTITAISGDTVSFTEPLIYDHKGADGTMKDGTYVSAYPVIANVSRSIRWRTASASEDGAIDPGADLTVLQKRAHSMFMRHPDVDARFFETKNMARTSTDPSLVNPDVGQRPSGWHVGLMELLDAKGGSPVTDPNNVRGRYSIHVHWCGGPYRNVSMIPLIGATAWSPIDEVPIPGWAITHHSSHVAIEDCVVSNVRGAGIVSEVGNEIGQWIGNVVTGCRGDGEIPSYNKRAELATNHNGHGGIAYENQSRAILQQDNVAGSSSYGWLWLHQKTNRWNRGIRPVDLRLADPIYRQSVSNLDYWEDDHLIGLNGTQILPFNDNEAFACRNAFSVQHRIGGESGPVKVPMLMERFVSVNSSRAWEVTQYSNTYYMRDCLFQGAETGQNTGHAATMGNVSWDWNFSNCLVRNYKYAFRDGGAGLNYEGHFIDIKLENVQEFMSPPTIYTVANAATHPARDIMGPWEIQTDPNKAIIRRYVNEDSTTDLPSIYPLEPYGRKLPVGHPPVNPGDTPYFVLGDGTNGAASTVPVPINLLLKPGLGRNQTEFYGIIRDSVGDRRYPDWQTSETFPNNLSVKGFGRKLDRYTPEDFIRAHGCWNDGGTWKVRAWFPTADRFTLKVFHFHVDYTLDAGFEPEFLARHDLGGPPPAPEWPDKPEVIPAPRSLTPLVKTLVFLSRPYLEAVDGQPLVHHLRTNEVTVDLEIVGGTDAGLFSIDGQMLVWSGTQPAVRGTPYQVTVKATDAWGNTASADHQVLVMPSAGVSASIEDDFNRPNENLEAKPGYTLLSGVSGGIVVLNNALNLPVIGLATYDLGSLGTSEQEISVNFLQGYAHLVLFRMIDKDNWLGFGSNNMGGGNVEIHMCVSGVVTKLCHFSNNNDVVMTCKGDLLRLTTRGTATSEPIPLYPKSNFASLLKIQDQNPRFETGSVLLPPAAPRGTRIGLHKMHTGASGSNLWLDNLSAKALPS